jgi:hypothetical protein
MLVLQPSVEMMDRFRPRSLICDRVRGGTSTVQPFPAE